MSAAQARCRAAALARTLGAPVYVCLDEAGDLVVSLAPGVGVIEILDPQSAKRR